MVTARTPAVLAQGFLRADQGLLDGNVSDETLRAAGMSVREAKLELACRRAGAGKFSIGRATGLVGMSLADFEAALEIRSIPRYRYTEEILEHDVEILKKLGR